MNCVLSPSSFNMSLAMVFSLGVNFEGSPLSHSARADISIAATSEIVFPSMRKQLVCSLRRVPWQTGHTTFSSISLTMPGKDTISDIVPSPTLKSSSEPNTIKDMTSSGNSSIGAYNETPYFLAIECITAYFRVSLILPRGTIPPSAMDTERSGMMVSILTSTIIPRPLQ